MTKVWVITGTSSGLGRSLVQTVLERGYNVVATARNVESLKEFSTDPKYETRFHALRLDVTSPFAELRIAAADAVRKWGRIDILVNNAGLGMPCITEEAGVEGYQKQFNTNFFGPLNVTNAFLPYMRAQRSGIIVFIGSRSSWRTNIAMIGPYSASKAALTAAAETLAAEVAHLGIKVLNVLPGALQTSNWINVIYQQTSPDALLPPLYTPENTVPNDSTNENKQKEKKPSNQNAAKSETETESEGHIADYAALRARQLEWMTKVLNEGDADKSAKAIVDVVTSEGSSLITKDGKTRGWPELDMLVLGRDAEANIRDKCNAVLRNLDEWQDVTRGILRDDLKES